MREAPGPAAEAVGRAVEVAAPPGPPDGSPVGEVDRSARDRAVGVAGSPALPDPRRARLRVGLGAVLVLAAAGLGIGVLVTALTPHGGEAVLGASVAPGSSGSAPAADGSTTGAGVGESGRVYVHLLGEVARPGLYELDEGSRAVDLIAAAGGFTEQADQSSVNLARFLVDGEQVVVPALGAAPAVGAGAGGAGGVAGKVNLNTADQAALETLPRIGPALAQRILDWRAANGRFTAIEDLLSVTGIGEKTFDGLRDKVTV
ncbi:MAG: ComEA family DNA-binding protein [Actinomycetales bacterium]|nr:ComEA family DNA-binding protein [Actinomycetales bacterium]